MPDERDVLVVVCGVVVVDGRVLVARRVPGRALGGLWEFPGGKVEAGETECGALVRELEEELGLRVEVGAPLAASRHAGGPGGGKVVELRPYWCRVDTVGTGRAEGEAADGVVPALELRDHDAVAWLVPGDPPWVALDWAPADVPVAAAVAAAVAVAGGRGAAGGRKSAGMGA